MQQLNTYRFYELGAKLHALFSLRTQGRVADMFSPLTEAQALLDGFIKGDPFPLESSKPDATRLLNKISSVFNRYFIDPATKQLKSPTGEDRIDPHELSLIQSMVDKFEHALAAELNRAPTYFAGKLGIYSTYDLAENARAIFAKDLRDVIPAAALNEVDYAGRALVFGLGTAAAMNMLRATEITLKPYYEIFAGAATSKGERNYAAYLKRLTAMSEEEDQALRPDKRVVHMLSQIKDHYRNPVITAENSIAVDDALSLFGMATAVITLMARQLREKDVPEDGKKNQAPPPQVPGNPADDDDGLYDFRLSQAS